jgi:ribosome biogenesis GTPase / thiamine phosphate phosphatase
MSESAGLVVARYRRHVTVENPRGERHVCQIQRRSLDPVVGDEVAWHPADGGGVVTSVAPRRTGLVRIDKRGRPETVAANLTQLLTVIAPEPAPDWFVLDRYLAAAELAGIAAVVVFNKAESASVVPSRLSVYREAGYIVHLTSAHRGIGLGALQVEMQDQCSAFVGQSGVGKSSLINALLGSELQTIGGLTAKGAQGRHTTSTAVLYRLPGGGTLIDSPGVRNFAPYIDEPAELENGYREFQRYLGSCKFDDCLHLAEPDCAIKHAVAAGSIAAHRYESYCGLYALTRSLAATRSRGASKR